MKGILSVSVPALVDGWLSAHEKYGRLSLAEVFAPAMDLATNGFPTSHVLAKAIAADPLICEFPTSKAVFGHDGRPLHPEEILYQRDLGRTFQAIIDGGADAFYRGEIARSLVRFSQEQGGLLTEADLPDVGAAGKSQFARAIAATPSMKRRPIRAVTCCCRNSIWSSILI